MSALQSPAGYFLGLLIGIWLPDIDLAIPYLPHRSALTHSILPGLILLGLRQPRLAAGILAALAIHLAADMFPRGWHGGALVYVPGLGSLGRWSVAFLAANMLAGLFIAYRLLRRPELDSPAILVTGLLALCYLLFKEWSFAGLAVFAASAWAVRRLG